MEKPKAIDLFAGCGGLTRGLRNAGFEVVGAVENEPVAAATYKLNHPGVDLKEVDIRTVKPRAWMKALGLKAGELELIAGCPPCQGFSNLRTLNGGKQNRDRRNSLAREMLRFIECFRPKAVMMENVPGLATRKVFREFTAILKELGYEPAWAVKDAARYGVPQRRRRLVVVAGHGCLVPFAREAKIQKTVRMAIAGLPKAGSSGDRLHDLPERRSPEVMRKIALIPRDGGSRSALPPQDQLPCHRHSDGFKDIYGRMSWDNVAPTITGGCFNPSKGRFLHPEEDRAITMREAALLQGFPRSFKVPETANKQQIALMIGNALPPTFIRRQALEIKKAIFSGDWNTCTENDARRS